VGYFLLARPVYEVVERIICGQQSHDLVRGLQHAYRKGHSTETALFHELCSTFTQPQTTGE